jgi:hypothetical protein
MPVVPAFISSNGDPGVLTPDLAAALALKEIEESRTIQDFKTQCVR